MLELSPTHLAMANIAVALLVTLIKAAAYWATGSVALYSDAAESVVNVATAIAALVSIRISRRPADRHHQFGHHKAEYFSSVLEGVLIAIAALVILREAWDAFLRPRELTGLSSGFAISAAAMAINAAWSAVLIREGRRRGSPALVADGWHLLSDVVTTIGVLIGLALASATGLGVLDPLMAAAVAIYILYAGWRLVRGSMSELMDEAVPPEIAGRIEALVKENGNGAIEMHGLRTRRAGAATFIEFHLVVPGRMTVSQSHAICDRIEDAIGADLPGAEVVIHVEPHDKAEETSVAIGGS